MPSQSDPVFRVFEVWRSTRPRPQSCRFTTDRRKLIRSRLKLGYTAEDLIALVRYVDQSNEGLPRWMRGENPAGRPFLDLDALLRVGKLGERVELALNWLERGGDLEGDVSAAVYGESHLGPLGAYRGEAGEA